jgi:hypothetical protein
MQHAAVQPIRDTRQLTLGDDDFLEENIHFLCVFLLVQINAAERLVYNGLF